MAETTISVDSEERDLLRDFKNHYGLDYNEAIVELVNAWPDDDWREGDSEGTSSLAAIEQRLAELEAGFEEHDETIEDLREGFLDLNDRVSGTSDGAPERGDDGLIPER